MKRLAKWLLVAALPAAALFWWLTEPVIEVVETSADKSADLENGQLVFWASGCASCHAADGAKGDEKLLLGGGHRLQTPFGTFVAPNISPDNEAGIGDWSFPQFAIAMRNGVSPGGKHYYPAFPYASYAAMSDADLKDLFGYINTLQAVSRVNETHDLALPFQWRRPLGLWKRLFANAPEQIIPESVVVQQLERGRYLVEVLGHCGECHTPRNLLGGLQSDRWLAGGPAPTGKGRIPNITPHGTGIGSWSAGDIVYYLESGFTPEFDSVGGSMTSVQENMTKLPKGDLEAIAAYLKAVPAELSE